MYIMYRIIMMKIHVRPTTCSYYQKLPAEMPAMEKHQVYGLATPEDFTLPPHHPLWTEETYAAFQVSTESSEKYDTKVCTAEKSMYMYAVTALCLLLAGLSCTGGDCPSTGARHCPRQGPPA